MSDSKKDLPRTVTVRIPEEPRAQDRPTAGEDPEDTTRGPGKGNEIMRKKIVRARARLPREDNALGRFLTEKDKVLGSHASLEEIKEILDLGHPESEEFFQLYCELRPLMKRLEKQPDDERTCRKALAILGKLPAKLDRVRTVRKCVKAGAGSGFALPEGPPPEGKELRDLLAVIKVMAR